MMRCASRRAGRGTRLVAWAAVVVPIGWLGALAMVGDHIHWIGPVTGWVAPGTVQSVTSRLVVCALAMSVVCVLLALVTNWRLRRRETDRRRAAALRARAAIRQRAIEPLWAQRFGTAAERRACGRRLIHAHQAIPDDEACRLIAAASVDGRASRGR